MRSIMTLGRSFGMLENVIAIAASAGSAAAGIDIAHALSIKTVLIIFGLATSVPLIIAGSAILMSLLERFPILVWAGAALLGWVAGEIIVKDAAVEAYLGRNLVEQVHVWSVPVGAVFVAATGFILLRLRRHPVESEV
jgi:predicted tellurium resistance membrane protein TerC